MSEKSIPASREERLLCDYVMDTFRKAISRVYSLNDKVYILSAIPRDADTMDLKFDVKGDQIPFVCLTSAMELGRTRGFNEDALRYAIMVTLAATWSYGTEIIAPRIVASCAMPAIPLSQATYIYEMAIFGANLGQKAINKGSWMCWRAATQLSKQMKVHEEDE